MWRRHRMLPFLLHAHNASQQLCPKCPVSADDKLCPCQPPPYSPDLSRCDFFLFPCIKRCVRGKDYPSVHELMAEVDDLIGQILTWHWKDCFKDWHRRALKCVDFDGNYFEGMKDPPPVV